MTRSMIVAVVALLVSGCADPEGGGSGGGGPGAGGGAGGSSAGGSGGSSAGGAGGSSAGGSGGSSAGGAGGSSAGGSGGSSAGGTGGSCDPGCTEGCVQGCFDAGACVGGGAELLLTPSLHTAGVVFTPAGAPATGELFHRPPGAAFWWRDTDAVAIPDGRLASSIFSLAPGTEYEVLVRAGGELSCGTVTTLPANPPHVTTATLEVRAGAAPGGDGSAAAPFATITDAVAAAGPGTDIHVAAGLYHEEVDVTGGGAAGSFLRFLGDPGAILDGADPAIVASGLPWTDDGGGAFSAPFDGDPSYLSRDGERSYHYTSLAGLEAGLGDDDVPIAEGWFVEGGSLHVRSADDPAGHSWQVPRLVAAFALDGASFVWIEGFELRFYGEGLYGKGIDVRASSDVVVRNNHIHEVATPVWIRRGSNRVRVEGNRLHQSSVHRWPWDASKGTDHENTAIAASGGTSALVAGNEIFAIFNGVGSGDFSDDQNPEISFDVDVSENRFADIADDVLEPEGACINNRFWGNVADRLLNGISLAPITFGPVFAVRNRFTDYTQSGFKVSNDSSGRVWLLQNTCFTDRPDQNGMNVSGPFANMVFRNNVIRGTAYALEMSQPALPNDLDHDALFSPRGPPLVKWDDVRYDDLVALCAATGLECHGVDADPELLAPLDGRFGPAPGSPLVGAAVRLYGINDAGGGAASIGYVEPGAAEVPPLP